jgi:hypothetical protein
MEMIAKKSINDDWGDEKELMKNLAMGSGKAAWNTLTHDQQQGIKKGLQKTAMTFLKYLKRSVTKYSGVLTSLPDIDNPEMAEYRGLTIHDLWAKENALLHPNTDLCDEENTKLDPNTDLLDEENTKLDPNTDLFDEENAQLHPNTVLFDEENAQLHPNTVLCD